MPRLPPVMTMTLSMPTFPLQTYAVGGKNNRHLRILHGTVIGPARSGQFQLLAAVDFLHEALGRQRVPQQITLQRITTELGQEVLLRACFDAFGDNPQAPCLTEGDNG